MSRDNLNGFAVSIERSFAPEKIGTDASTTSAPWVPRISHEILRDLGMSDDAIVQCFCRFRHGQLERFVQLVPHKRGWMCRSWRGHMSNEGVLSFPKRNTTSTRQKARRRLV
jgi:hypothetical protein